jgi:head-tail adaptor
MSVGPAAASLRLRAQTVRLEQARDHNGDVILLLQSAADGEVEISAEKQEIENAIAAVATREAGKHGVAIDQVQLSISVRGERSVDAEVRLRARKLFFSTVVRIGAKLDLDEQLNAKLSGLTCNGEGAIGALACGGLQPHLHKLDGRSFSLMALPLGEVRLRDVRLAAGARISVRAEFGS